MKFCVFFGSYRENCVGLVAAKYIVKLLKAKRHDVVLFDPLEHQFPTVQQPHDFDNDPAKIPQQLSDVHQHILSADAFFAVSAEYNRSVPPVLTNTLGHFTPADFQQKACGIVTYSVGHFGGLAAAVQLRSFLGILGMVTPGYMFNIPKINDAFTTSGEPKNDVVTLGGQRIVREVEWCAEALRAQRSKNGIPSKGNIR